MRARTVQQEKHFVSASSFFSMKELKVRTEFLALIPVLEISGGALVNAVKICLDDFGLNLTKCIGFASDGVYNTWWDSTTHHGLVLCQMKCQCHNLACALPKCSTTASQLVS